MNERLLCFHTLHILLSFSTFFFLLLLEPYKNGENSVLLENQGVLVITVLAFAMCQN